MQIVAKSTPKVPLTEFFKYYCKHTAWNFNKKDSGTVVFLWIVKFSEELFCRTPSRNWTAVKNLFISSCQPSMNMGGADGKRGISWSYYKQWLFKKWFCKKTADWRIGFKITGRLVTLLNQSVFTNSLVQKLTKHMSIFHCALLKISKEYSICYKKVPHQVTKSKKILTQPEVKSPQKLSRWRGPFGWSLEQPYSGGCVCINKTILVKPQTKMIRAMENLESNDIFGTSIISNLILADLVAGISVIASSCW